MNNPHEYIVVSTNDDAYGTPKAIYLGSLEQCKMQLEEIRYHNKDYAENCYIEKYKQA